MALGCWGKYLSQFLRGEEQRASVQSLSPRTPKIHSSRGWWLIPHPAIISWHPRQELEVAAIRLTYIRGYWVSIKAGHALRVWTKSNVDKVGEQQEAWVHSWAWCAPWGFLQMAPMITIMLQLKLSKNSGWGCRRNRALRVQRKCTVQKMWLKRVREKCPSIETFTSFSWKAMAGNEGLGGKCPPTPGA